MNLLEGSAMTFDEWLVREHGCNHGWTFSEVGAARDAWEAATKAEREANKAVLVAQNTAHHREVQEQVAAEREACAKVCEELDGGWGIEPYTRCAAAIRAR
jgi:hypothetical protein